MNKSNKRNAKLPQGKNAKLTQRHVKQDLTTWRNLPCLPLACFNNVKMLILLQFDL